MELNQLVNELLESGIVENQALALTLLRSPDMPEEEKIRHIDDFIQKYNKSNEELFSEEKKGVFDAWMEVYQATMANRIKNRVKKIV